VGRLHHAQVRGVEEQSLQLVDWRQEVLNLLLTLNEDFFALLILIPVYSVEGLRVDHDNSVQNLFLAFCKFLLQLYKLRLQLLRQSFLVAFLLNLPGIVFVDKVSVAELLIVF
jgi:hypothetical protein